MQLDSSIVGTDFWQSVEYTETCFLWRGAATDGYIASDGLVVPLLRAAWLAGRGPLPDDLEVAHHCSEPLCVNPEHLYLRSPVPGRGAYVRMWSHRGRSKDASLEKVTRDNGDGKRRCGKYADKDTRLSDEVVVDIRAAYAAGGITLQSLADSYGITRVIIHEAVNGRRNKYSHIPSCPPPVLALTKAEIEEARHDFLIKRVSLANLASRLGVSKPRLRAAIYDKALV